MLEPNRVLSLLKSTPLILLSSSMSSCAKLSGVEGSLVASKRKYLEIGSFAARPPMSRLDSALPSLTACGGSSLCRTASRWLHSQAAPFLDHARNDKNERIGNQG